MLKSGTRFGAYTILDMLGRGGMGVVYEAEHTGLHKRVALKVLQPIDEEDGLRQRFLLEGRAAAKIRHEHIVDVTDVGVHEDTPYLVMELLSGETLAQRIAREGALPAEHVADMLIPVAAAIAAAHEAGVLHRDLKPENIFLARSRRGEVVPKVVDFGVSRVGAVDDDAMRLTGSTNLIGTPRYLAPEAVLSARNVVAASDQYALGAVLYECATGEHAFADGSLFALLSEILRSHFRAPSEVNPDVDPRLEAVIVRAMQREPGDRLPSVRALAAALLPIASDRTRAHWTEELTTRADLETEPSRQSLTRSVAPEGIPTGVVHANPTLAAAGQTPRVVEGTPTRVVGASPPRVTRWVPLSVGVALLCAVAFFVGRTTPTQRNAARSERPIVTASASVVPASVVPASVVPAPVVPAPVVPAPIAPSFRLGAARPVVRRAARPVLNPSVVLVAPPPTPATDAGALPRTSWSLRTRF